MSVPPVLWARVKAAIFDANITPATRGYRLPSILSQPVLHIVLSASRLGTATAIEAIVRQDERRASNGATRGGRPLPLPDA
jgi:hypothetical protein